MQLLLPLLICTFNIFRKLDWPLLEPQMRILRNCQRLVQKQHKLICHFKSVRITESPYKTHFPEIKHYGNSYQGIEVTDEFTSI